ncbi:MFS transporter [Rhodococcus opacus]|uniref:MFS transporter n=1 Tax=Rhodococcus opacus TaxID=37919 RepID=UPI001C458B4C|nr:MFS transporter [Rhodococcus opacus]MBV6759059.1 MFS transporter [Rhodococcus opacus]
MTTIDPPSQVSPAGHRENFETKAAQIRRRQQLVRLPASLFVPVIGGMLILVADAQALALIPLQASLVTSYGLTASQAGWTLSATAIATAAAVPILTRMGDRYGLRRMLLVSMGFVTIGQLLCALAEEFPLLVIGRTILGMSAAIAIIYSLIRDTTRDAHAVNRAMGILTSFTGVGIGASFLAGGTILKLDGTVTTFFWIITVLGAILWLLSWLFIQDSPIRAKSSVDWVGGLTLAALLVMLVIAIAQGNEWGWGSSAVITLLVGAAVAAVFWTAWELRVSAPMIDVRILSRRSVWPAALVMGLASALGVYTSLVVSGYVQTPSAAGYGMTASPLMAGVYLLPISLPIAFGGVLAAPIIRALGQRACMILASTLIVVDLLWFAFFHSNAIEIVIGTAIFGSAYALGSTAAIGSTMTTARRGEAGMLSSIATVGVTVGNAISPAIFVATLTASFAFIPGTEILVPAEDNYRTALLYGAALGAVMLIAALVAKSPQFSNELAEDAELVG